MGAAQQKQIENTPQQLLDVVMHFNERFDAHQSEEMARYDDIYREIKSGSERSDRRHNEAANRISELIESVRLLGDKQDHQADRLHQAPCDQLRAAILHEDFKGHHDEHAEEEKRKADNADLFQKIKVEIAKYAVGGFLGLVALSMWHDIVRAFHSTFGG